MSQPLNTSAIADEILSCPHFRMVLREIVQELSDDIKSKEPSTNDGEASLQGLIEEIGEQIEVMAREQAEKQLQISEQLARQSYEIRRNEEIDMMERKMNEQLAKIRKQIAEELQSVQNLRCMELSLNQSRQKSESMSRIKRNKIKEMLLQSETSFDDKRLDQTEPLSPISFDVDVDSQFGKLSHQLNLIRDEFNKSIKTLSQKVKSEQIKTGQALQKIEASFKEQLQGNFEGIWNIISNLQKRMLYMDTEANS